MADLQKEGKIKHLALTNFDTERLKIITEAGIKIVSNQVQFSLIDRRPLGKMVQFCRANNIKILAYGTLCGGLLSENYVRTTRAGALEFANREFGEIQKYD